MLPVSISFENDFLQKKSSFLLVLAHYSFTHCTHVSLIYMALESVNLLKTSAAIFSAIVFLPSGPILQRGQNWGEEGGWKM